MNPSEIVGQALEERRLPLETRHVLGTNLCQPANTAKYLSCQGLAGKLFVLTYIFCLPNLIFKNASTPS